MSLYFLYWIQSSYMGTPTNGRLHDKITKPDSWLHEKNYLNWLMQLVFILFRVFNNLEYDYP